MRASTLVLLFAFCAPPLCGDEPNEQTRPVSEANSVLAVYVEDHGLRPGAGTPAVILVAWPDGRIIWSTDRIKGGAPYRAGRVDPKKVESLLSRFEQDGLFADEKLNRGNFGPDSSFTTVNIKLGKKQVKKQSWHELFEQLDTTVANHTGVSALQGRRRLDVLRASPADYLFFRFVWSETRLKLSDLIPPESVASTGKPVMNAGALSWQDGAASPESKATAAPSRR